MLVISNCFFPEARIKQYNTILAGILARLTLRGLPTQKAQWQRCSKSFKRHTAAGTAPAFIRIPYLRFSA